MTLQEAEKRIAALEEEVRELKRTPEFDPEDYAAAMTDAIKRSLGKEEHHATH